MGGIRAGEEYEISTVNGVKQFRLIDGTLNVSFSGFADRNEAKRFLLALSTFADAWR
jgi:hypothetical protein